MSLLIYVWLVMVSYKRFEDLPVWQAARLLSVATFRLCEDKCFAFQGDVRIQMQKAALSVASNIAEGFERGSTQDIISFIYYARGSAGEIRSICYTLLALERYKHLSTGLSDLQEQSSGVGRQLKAWADSLNRSKIRGQRYFSS